MAPAKCPCLLALRKGPGCRLATTYAHVVRSSIAWPPLCYGPVRVGSGNPALMLGFSCDLLDIPCCCILP
ncbi:hypothetical protein WJX77_009550 [Trebouxia sp. C0004]